MAIEEDHATQGGVWNTTWKRWEWRDGHRLFHRVAGPAVIWPDGSHEWYLHGQFHRVAGPAEIWTDGTQVWRLHGQLHRADGPAIIYTDGRQSWYVQGCCRTAEIEAWMGANSVTWPFTESQQMEFALRWL
jgi:hypothetical protein